MRFLRSIQRDAKLFIYIYILLMLFRCAFLIIYSGQLGNAGAGDIAEALWLGARISLKTTAFLVAFPFIFATIPYSFWLRWPVQKIRNILGSAAIAIMTVLFMARIPYYEAFHHAFDIMLFNGMTDDKAATLGHCCPSVSVLGPRLVWGCRTYRLVCPFCGCV